MTTINFIELMAEYEVYRMEQDTIEGKVTALQYESCRVNFNEIMNALGIEVKHFKQKSQFEFAKQDTPLLFELLDRFTNKEFKHIRKGKFAQVPAATVMFYIETFTTLLLHIGAKEEVVAAQREAMLRATDYELIVEIEAAEKQLQGIRMDLLKTRAAYDDELSYQDHVVYMQFVAHKLKAVQDQLRHVYLNMSNQREEEDMLFLSQAIKQTSEDNRAKLKQRISEKLKLQQTLNKHERYAELYEQLEQLLEKPDFLKSKFKKLKTITEEMEQISYEVETKLFGERIMDRQVQEDLQEPLQEQEHKQQQLQAQVIESSKSSEQLLANALHSYELLKRVRLEADPDDGGIVADILCKDFFESGD